MNLSKNWPYIVISGIIIACALWVVSIITTPAHERSHTDSPLHLKRDSTLESYIQEDFHLGANLFPLSLNMSSGKLQVTSRYDSRYVVSIQQVDNGMHDIFAYRLPKASSGINPNGIEVRVSADSSSGEMLYPEMPDGSNKTGIENTFVSAFKLITTAHMRYHANGESNTHNLDTNDIIMGFALAQAELN